MKTKNENVNQVGEGEGAVGEGARATKNCWKKFDYNLRSFGNVLHVKSQKLGSRWLIPCFLIFTSPSTFSYSFSLSFFGHCHSFTHSISTNSFLLSKKPCNIGSVISIFGNIEIKKNFQKLHVSNKWTTT